MRKYALQRHRVSFIVSELTDDDRTDLIAGIAKVAPSSPFIQNNPALQTSAAALVARGAALKASRETAAGSRKAADLDEGKANSDRSAVDAELLAFVGLVEANAKSDDDITSAALTPRSPKPPKPPFAPPDAIDVSFPAKGKIKVSPHGVAKHSTHWAVQVSPDPAGEGTWVEVHGVGKTRILTGESGTRIWVRYAMVRGSEKSAWSTPVLVTFP